MDELDLIDTPLVAGDLGQMLIHFAFHLVVIWVIIQFLYYAKSKRKDYYFTFMLMGISIFFLIYLLAGVKLKIGVALGLFAIFGIMRFRTESMPVREMTYLFVLIAISVINALSVNFLELVITNVIFIVAIALCEFSYKWMRHVECKYIKYDRVDLIKPEQSEELKADLEQRTGLKIMKIEVGAIDFLRDSVMIKVYYDSGKEPANSVNTKFKFPKGTEE
ncbi:MAG: DUF4956 domain-containing protein [Bacteroidales bacterium]|nr:DUF4956 domain-containing protein [Bacteroidales bacterium]